MTIDLTPGLDLATIAPAVPATEAPLFPRAGLLTYDSIPELPWSWRWPGVIPDFTPVMYVAMGGTGKGILGAAIMARETTGDPYPGQLASARRNPGTVLFIGPEDDPNRTQRGRLEAAGADCRYVVHLTHWADGTTVELPTDVPKLAKLIKDIADPENEEYAHLPAVSMVIVDPLSKVIPEGATIATRNGANKVLVPLVALAESAHVAVVIFHHTNWDGKTNGSRALYDSLRGAYVIEYGDDPDVRVVSLAKSNGDFSKGFSYRIAGPKGRGRAEFIAQGDAMREKIAQADALALTAGLANVAELAPEPYRVGRLMLSADGTPTRKVLGDVAGLAEAKRLAQADEFAGGIKLVWSDKDEGSHVALRRLPADGSTVGYSCFPIEAREVPPEEPAVALSA